MVRAAAQPSREALEALGPGARHGASDHPVGAADEVRARWNRCDDPARLLHPRPVARAARDQGLLSQPADLFLLRGLPAVARARALRQTGWAGPAADADGREGR